MRSCIEDITILLLVVCLWTYFYSLVYYAMKTQKQRVLELLQSKSQKWVWCYEFAMKYGILRYWQHIHILRKEWYNIIMTEKRVKKRGNWQRQTTYFLV